MHELDRGNRTTTACTPQHGLPAIWTPIANCARLGRSIPANWRGTTPTLPATGISTAAPTSTAPPTSTREGWTHSTGWDCAAAIEEADEHLAGMREYAILGGGPPSTRRSQQAESLPTTSARLGDEENGKDTEREQARSRPACAEAKMRRQQQPARQGRGRRLAIGIVDADYLADEKKALLLGSCSLQARPRPEERQRRDPAIIVETRLHAEGNLLTSDRQAEMELPQGRHQGAGRRSKKSRAGVTTWKRAARWSRPRLRGLAASELNSWTQPACANSRRHGYEAFEMNARRHNRWPMRSRPGQVDADLNCNIEHAAPTAT